ncbi:MAG: hypothetical protein BKP49_10510 [Treponema sp. CETP13]|nr:MAG: hypothetical protein BKP49_10510 [Treponema sp. CETP13]
METKVVEKAIKTTKNKYIVTGANTIMNTKYPPQYFIVENLIPANGLILFAGPPKIGKSWLVLQLLLNISGGKDMFLGHKVMEYGSCLYLSLEDSASRIKSRIIKQGNEPGDNNLMFAFEWRKNEQGVADINNFLSEHGDVKVVCIDTKGKFSEGRGEEGFQNDYTWMSALKSVADKKKIAIILITHLRKRKPDEDMYEAIAGTVANMAAADTTIMLKRARNQNKGTLYLTSRDFPETEEDIFFDQNNCTWKTPNGVVSVVTENLTPERKKIVDAIKQLGREGSPKEIADIIGGSAKNVSNMLTTMKKCGFVDNGTKRGFWKVPEMVDNDKKTCEIQAMES